jgi:hypothetical protein
LFRKVQISSEFVIPKYSKNKRFKPKYDKGMYYLGATEPRLHSDSKEGRTAGFLTAVRMTLRAVIQVCPWFSGKVKDRSPKAIGLFDVAMAGSRKGSSISTRKRILCLTSWKQHGKEINRNILTLKNKLNL